MTPPEPASTGKRRPLIYACLSPATQLHRVASTIMQGRCASGCPDALLRAFAVSLTLLAALAAIGVSADAEPFRFVILGDRTGEAQAGVYEQIWKEIISENPALVISVGDTIQGLNDAAAKTEWNEIEQLLKPYRQIPIYLTPGNHDIWSAASERLFRKYARQPPRHGFDYRQAHFTILDNSRSEDLSGEDLAFLENDLKAHQSQPVKFIFSHRPSWLMAVALRNPNFKLHQLARRYNVKYVIAGHIHQMLRFDLEGVTYLSMPSAGGHLRASRQYQAGWFFGHALVQVQGTDIRFEIREVKAPHGAARVTSPTDWGMLGLVSKEAPAGAAR
jgi:predicted phosphodiesterase